MNPVHIHKITSWWSILILSSNACLGLPIGLFPWRLLTKICTHFSLCPCSHQDFVTWLALSRNTEDYKRQSPSLTSLLWQNKKFTAYVNNCPTWCNTKQPIYYSEGSSYMFRASTTPIIRSTQNCNYSLWYQSLFLCSYLPPTWPS